MTAESFSRGDAVRSLAGRDEGYFLVVVAVESGGVRVCDGKERPLSRPKFKNPKHLARTDFRLSEEQMRTDRQIRIALRDRFGGGQRGVKDV